MTKNQIDEMIKYVKDDVALEKTLYRKGACVKITFALSLVSGYIKDLRETAEAVASFYIEELPLQVNNKLTVFREMVAYRLERGI